MLLYGLEQTSNDGGLTKGRLVLILLLLPPQEIRCMAEIVITMALCIFLHFKTLVDIWRAG